MEWIWVRWIWSGYKGQGGQPDLRHLLRKMKIGQISYPHFSLVRPFFPSCNQRGKTTQTGRAKASALGADGAGVVLVGVLGLRGEDVFLD